MKLLEPPCVVLSLCRISLSPLWAPVTALWLPSPSLQPGDTQPCLPELFLGAFSTSPAQCLMVQAFWLLCSPDLVSSMSCLMSSSPSIRILESLLDSPSTWCRNLIALWDLSRPDPPASGAPGLVSALSHCWKDLGRGVTQGTCMEHPNICLQRRVACVTDSLGLSF